MASRAEPACIPARFVGVGAQEALEAAIRRVFQLYDRLRGKLKRKDPPADEPSTTPED
jgi:hypothetical protein